MNPLSANAHPSAARGPRLDVAELVSVLSQKLPRRNSGLLTPFAEVALLIERLAAAGLDVEIERRTYREENAQYSVALAAKVEGQCFCMRSLEPWEDFEHWKGVHLGVPLRQVDNAMVPEDEVQDMMRRCEVAYAAYRPTVDQAIEMALAQGSSRALEESTVEATGQGVALRL